MESIYPTFELFGSALSTDGTSIRETELSDRQKMKKLQYKENATLETIHFDKGNHYHTFSFIFFHLFPVSYFSQGT